MDNEIRQPHAVLDLPSRSWKAEKIAPLAGTLLQNTPPLQERTSQMGAKALRHPTQSHFTNLSLRLFSAAVIIFLIGLISEQITSLLYRPVS